MISASVLKELHIWQNELAAAIVSKEKSRAIVKMLSEFILFLSEDNQNDFLAANIAEYRELFWHSVQKYPAAGCEPETTEMVITAIEKMIPISEKNEKLFYVNELIRLKKELIILREWLTGQKKNLQDDKELFSHFYFPLLERTDEHGYGCYLDSVKVNLIQTEKETRFIILSKYNDKEGTLLSQVKESFDYALGLVRSWQRVSRKQYFNVHVMFNHDYGEYTGKSFGAALTLAFLVEIKKHFNNEAEFKPKINLVITGEVTSSGKLKRTGDQNISMKTEGVFYSQADVFVIPQDDFTAAREKFLLLAEKYPQRNLIILPVYEISEIFLRRDLIEIEKKSIINRSLYFLIRHSLLILMILLLFTVSTLYIITTIDQNPAAIKASGQTVTVLNKSGRVLWTRETELTQSAVFENQVESPAFWITDVNYDGINEVLIAYLKKNPRIGIKSDRPLVLFSNTGSVIWEFKFTDTIYSNREGYMEQDYGSDIACIYENNGKKIVCVLNNNGPSYTSALIKIDAETGERLNGTVWNAGHLQGAIHLQSSVGERSLLVIAANNGFETQTGFIIPEDFEDCQIITTEDYKLRGIKDFYPQFLIRIPKTDYDILNKVRGSSGVAKTLTEYPPGVVQISTFDPSGGSKGFLLYRLNIESSELTVFVQSYFRVLRDSLVSAGILNPPLTDTKEYTTAIRDSIEYYFNGKWIKYQDYHRLRKEGKLKVNK